jgi:phosphohistidine phosphatase SixA
MLEPLMMMMLHRRAFVIAAAAALPAHAHARAAGGPVLLMRHAQTDPGVGDPPGFVQGRCATQRNLSPDGRAQASAFGARLGTLGLRPTAIRSSRWCRCLHTADEVARGLGTAALAAQPWQALDSFFEDRQREPQQTALLRERLAAMRGPGFELWVSHQVNIAAFVGAATQMGQAVWIKPRADGSIAATPFET